MTTKIYITEDEHDRIGSTPQCHICDELCNNTFHDSDGYYVLASDDLPREHLEQIINRKTS